jgi:hypothetical protein
MDDVCDIKLESVRVGDELEKKFWRAKISVAKWQGHPPLGGHSAHIRGTPTMNERTHWLSGFAL